MVGGSDRALIMRSCAKDGRLLQPDRPMQMLNSQLLKLSGASRVQSGTTTYPAIMLTETAMNVGGQTWKWQYVMAVNNEPASITATELYALQSGAYLAWETNSSSAPQAFGPGDANPIALKASDKSTFQVWTAAPKFDNGWVLMGEAATKWVAVSSDRFEKLTVSELGFSIEVKGSAGEVVEVMAAPPKALKPVVVRCALPPSGTALLAFAAGATPRCTAL